MASGAEEGPEQSSSAVRAGPSQVQQAGQLEAAAEDLCPICMNTIRKATHVPGCFHCFCFGCIHQWARRRSTCPVCRQPFDHVLHVVRLDDGYRERAVSTSACRQRSAARNRVRSRSPQRRYNLRPRPTNSGQGAGRRQPERRNQAVRGDTAPGFPNVPAQQAAGERPDSPPVRHSLRTILVLVAQSQPTWLPERRHQ
ncbi:E3 ubiquitin-protein ligase Topors-like [Rissa tridactyla]|uniref:E3 ubiquitin-protein ligase Topors-like n=1 Tax=Rissa tridactyla TaxID=75485 RepID=UPI0023BA68A6|nr:E3 ubiquitin-protein ligase Topors-like [Rissa tridactyla]